MKLRKNSPQVSTLAKGSILQNSPSISGTWALQFSILFDVVRLQDQPGYTLTSKTKAARPSCVRLRDR